MTAITAAVVREPGGDFEFAHLELAPPQAHEVRVRLIAVGICHADVLSRDQIYPIALPAVLGHEGAGIVEAVGADVSSLQVGDHVVLGFNYCGHCRQCRLGFPGNCGRTAEYNFSGTRPDGSTSLLENGSPVSSWYFGQSSFATHTNVSDRTAVRVPDHLPLSALAPFGCGVMTGAGSVLNVLRPPAGSSIAVLGAGAVGMSALLAAHLTGCTTIIAIDIVESRLELALELGATHAVNAAKSDPVSAVKAITRGRGVEHAVDAAGSPRVFRQMLEMLSIRGHGVLVGAPSPGDEISLDLNPSLGAGHRISFVLEGDGHPQEFIPDLVKLFEAKLLPLERLVTQYPFADINTAVADALDGKSVKPVLVFP